MYKVDKATNEILEIESKSFHDFGFSERGHLQEWIAKYPKCLGEDFLIIQKEFDGFNDTNERLDLLALDKEGTIVVIENKLDDTGKDVTWQALKYVSYCSTLSKQQISDVYQAYLDKTAPSEKAEDNIAAFLDGKPFSEVALNENDQRMILVAAKYRKEVTSTVMWMINHSIKVQCFKVTPYGFNGEVILDMEQIIPIKEAEDYIIKMADKTRVEKAVKEMNRDLQELRRVFWSELLEKFSAQSTLFNNVSPGADHWLGAGSGVTGVAFNFVVTKNYASVELFILKANQEENKKIFDNLYSVKNSIEENYGSNLTWERMEEKKSSRITERMLGVDGTNKDEWDEIMEFLCDRMARLEKAIREPLKKAATK